MNRFYFLQEAIVGGPFMLLLILIALGSFFIAVAIIAYTLIRMSREKGEHKNIKTQNLSSKNIIEDYKNGNLKPDGSFIIINFGIAIILIIAAIIMFFKIATIKFD